MKHARTPLKHRDLISKMSLQEKASLLSGANFWNTKPIERLGVPSIMLTDGPHGLRKQGGKSDHLGLNASLPATAFPTAATLASSWDEDLLHKVGAAIGEEAKAENVNVVLGPGLNLVRNPLSGRTFEYFSEDPYVTGKLAASLTRGIQSTGVAASPKHFAVNSQELLRMTMNEIVDERSLHELYLEGFRRVVTEAQPQVIMSSYNRVNGEFVNETPRLLDQILRKDWGFSGVVVTDWGGEHDRVAGLLAGNHLEMPSSGEITDKEVEVAVEKGDVPVSLLDERVNDLLELIFTTHQTLLEAVGVNTAALHDKHHKLAVEAAERSMVLLRNEDNALPLKRAKSVAVIGDFALTPRYQGAGSSLINPTQLNNAYDELVAAGVEISGYARGYLRFGKSRTRFVREAVKVARGADVALVFLGLDEASEAEGMDRQHMRLPQNQLELMAALLEAGIRPVVVLAGGAPVELPFADGTAAILHSQLGGQGSGRAVARILTGAVNPSGKLAVSYPLTCNDVPSAKYFPGRETTAEHREGLYIGYRYYDTVMADVRYPFGHGLSYTDFTYSRLSASQEAVSITVKNTGNKTGAETVQVYVRPLDSPVHSPRQELRAFAKVTLKPGEKERITLTLDDHAFAHYSVKHSKWVTIAGRYEIAVGASSRDIAHTAIIDVTGKSAKSFIPSTAEKTSSTYKLLEIYRTGNVQDASSAAFAALLGVKKLPRSTWNRRKKLTKYDTLRQLQYANWLGRGFLRLMLAYRWFLLKIGRPLQGNNVFFAIDMPFYKLTRFSQGGVTERRIRRILWWVNLGKRR